MLRKNPTITDVEIEFYLDQADVDRKMIWGCLTRKGRLKLEADLARRGLPPPKWSMRQPRG